MLSLLAAVWLAATPVDPNMPADVPGSDTDMHRAADAAVKAAQAAAAAADAARQAAEGMLKFTESTALRLDTTPSLPKPSPWGFHLGLSVLAVSGNANARSGNLSTGVDGHWHDWNTELRLTAAYGKTSANVGEPAQLTAFNGEARLRGERTYNATLGTYLLVGAATDHIASIRYQLYGEGGISLVWWEDKRPDFLRSRLRTSLGFRATRESHFQYIPVEAPVADPIKNIYAPTLAVNFRFGISATAYFSEDFELQQDVTDGRDLRLKSITGLTAQVMEGVALNLTYTVRRLGSPAAGKEPTDTELAAGATWSW